MSKIDVKLNGWIDDNMKNFRENFENEIRKYSSEAVKKTSDETKKYMRDKAKSKFNFKKRTFLNTFTSHIYNKKPEKLNSIVFFNKIQWFHIYDSGGKISKRVLIPLLANQKGRMQRKTFDNIIKTLKDTNTSFFKKVNGKLILFAKADKSNTKVISKFRKQYRIDNNTKSIKKGTAIPIGIVVNGLTVKKRYNFKSEIEPFAKKTLNKNLKVKINFNN